MYTEFELWLDNALEPVVSKETVAFNFNLYDDGDDNWSIELVGTASFDEDNDDWACDEVFATRENPFSWNEDATWDDVLNKVSVLIENYLENGKKAKILKKSKGVGVGFVDGDLVILYKNKQGGFFKKLFGRC